MSGRGESLGAARFDRGDHLGDAARPEVRVGVEGLPRGRHEAMVRDSPETYHDGMGRDEAKQDRYRHLEPPVTPDQMMESVDTSVLEARDDGYREQEWVLRNASG